jgi:choice-of-anchor B domain-containing protein
MLRRLLAITGLLGVAGTTVAPAQSTANPIGRDALQQFGIAVAVLPNQIFVGEPSGAAAPGGRVHVYSRTAATWRAGAQALTVEGLPAGTFFGAALAAEGNTLLVGMRNQVDSARGGVRVFTRAADGSWSDAGALGGTPVARSGFGWSVALAGDLALVGAPTTQPGGAVHVFRRSGTTWTAAGTLPADSLVAGDRFGTAISIDGDRVAVSAPGRDSQKGAVFVFRRGTDGSWTREGMLSGRRAVANSQMGASLLLSGNEIWAGAPNANGFTGMVVGFSRNSAGAWAESRTFTPFEEGATRFGASIVKVGNELMIGAPSDSRTGMIYRATLDSAGHVGTLTRFTSDSAASGSGFGAVIRNNGNTMAVGMPGDAGGEGTLAIYTKGATGGWRMSGNFYPQSGPGLTAMTNGEKACNPEGKSEGYPCANTSLLSFLPITAIGGRRGSRLSGNWGWTDPETGRDYALIGRTDGTSFVDVTDPARPRYLGDMPKTPAANASSWREMKTFRNYLLVVADGAGPHGVQIFDLTRLRGVTAPRTWSPDVTYDQVASVHDILTNSETGYAYAVGTNGGGESCGGGYHIIDMRQPLQPKFAGCFQDTKTGRAGTGYSHDALCVIYRGPDEAYRGREICVGSNETAISITDLTDKQNMKHISRASYPDVGYTHQGWWTEDHRYFYVNDELDETGGLGEAAKATRTLVFDLADLDDPVLVKQFLGTTKASDHNLYVKGNRMYQSNYKAGLRIIDVSDPVNPREVGFFDVAPNDDNSPGFSGSWNNYPFFRNGAILVSSIENGIYMVRDRTQAVP